VEFVDGESLPPYCLLCGEDAESYVIVGEQDEPSQKDKVYFFSRIAAALSGLLAIPINRESERKKLKISVRIPVCRSHVASRLLKPLYVDYDRYRLTFPAHRMFIEKWRPSTAPPSPKSGENG
jgi:hypothetical protein